MVDDAQKVRPHRIDKKEVETKRAMPREVSVSYDKQTINQNCSLTL